MCKMKFHSLLYFLSLICLLIYAIAYSFDYINADLSYPGGKNDGLSLVGMIVFFPLYTLIAGILLINHDLSWLKRILYSFIITILMFMAISLLIHFRPTF